VRLEYFTEGNSGIVIPGHECRSCGETERLLEDLAACSTLMTLTVHDRGRDSNAFSAFGIDKVPGLALVGAQDHGIRFYGMPAGYELRNLLEIVLDVGRGAADLAAETQQGLAGLPADVHLQVLVTPT
jgi:alkyl hydroperoxide reductase subunit AhpF